MSNKITVDRVIAGFIQARDKKTAIVAGHKKELEPINEKLERFGAWLTAKMHQDGTTQLKVKGVGTAFEKTRVTTSVENWSDFLVWVQNNEQWEMLPHAANKTVVMEYVEANEELPPGVKLSRMATVNVRK